MSENELGGAALRGAVDLSSLANRGTNATPPNGESPQQGSGTTTVADLVLDGSDSQVESFVQLSMTVPVIVDFWSERSEPSKQLTASLTTIVRESGGKLLLMKVDADSNPQLAQAFQAQSVPLVGLLLGGRPMQLFQEVPPENQLREIVQQVLQIAQQQGVSGTVAVEGGGTEETVEEKPLPPLHQEAQDAIEAGDYDRAIAAYDKAIAQSPKDDEARAGRAQVALLVRLDGRGLEEIRQAAAAAPDDIDAQMAVADLDVSGGHVEDAFDRLLTLFSDADDESRKAVRERLLDLFQVVGNADSRVTRARARLASLLF